VGILLIPVLGFIPSLCYSQVGEGLSVRQSQRTIEKLWSAHSLRLREERAPEMKARILEIGGVRMPFWFKVYGKEPKGGHTLWISLHGGGGTTKEINDGQWHNQQKLYTPKEGIYLAPRGPTDTWNLWHRSHMDPLLDRLIENLIIFEGVNPNRVFLLGYSAGGDGVYQLAPRMADRWAAAAMMAGHPGDARAEPLRNLPFTLHMGGKDSAYKRNEWAERWKERLTVLADENPGDYRHWVEVHADKGHWMDREDAAAVPWMSQFERDLRPKRITWIQDDVLHSRFYWLAVDAPQKGAVLDVERQGQIFTVHAIEGVDSFRIRLDDSMVNLNRAIKVVEGEEILFEGIVPRDEDCIQQTLNERGDPSGVFTAEVAIRVRSEVFNEKFDSPESFDRFDFSDAQVLNWSEEGGGSLGWSEGSSYRPPFRSPLTVALLKDVEVRDFVLDAEVMQSGKEYAHRDICFFFQFESASKYRYIHLATQPDRNAHNVFSVAAADRRPLLDVQAKGVRWGRKEWHHVRIDSSSHRGTVQVFFDDMKRPVMETVLEGEGWGRVGFGSFDDPGRIRVFRLRASASRLAESGNPFD